MAEQQQYLDFNAFYEEANELPETVTDDSVTDSDGITDKAEVTEPVETPEKDVEADVVGDEAPETDEEVSDSQELVYEIDGEEISADTLKEWKEGSLRQADYTKKTQAIAEERKQLEAKQAEIGERAEKLELLIADIEKLQDKQEIDWDYLRETDTAEYLKQKELAEKRNQAAEAAKQALNDQKMQDQNNLVQSEQKKLLELHPDWVEGGQLTEAGKADFKLINDYVESVGFSKEEFKDLTNHRIMDSLLKAAKYEQLKDGKATETKKAKKAPKVVKPSVKKTTKQKPKSAVDVFYS